MYYDGFHRSFCDDDDDLNIIQESDSIFAFETPETFKLENLRTKRGTLYIFKKFLNLLLCNLLIPAHLFDRESSGKPESQPLEVWDRDQQDAIFHARGHDSLNCITKQKPGT